ncbi:hypothetical protein B0H13DRAFT_1649694, partial [Mycena leptocephala]
FPPLPPTQKLRHEIITGMCSDVDPDNIEEAGCAVCGQLTNTRELTPMTQLELQPEQFSDFCPVLDLAHQA